MAKLLVEVSLAHNKVCTHVSPLLTSRKYSSGGSGGVTASLLANKSGD